MIPYSQVTLAQRLQNAYFRANWAHVQAGHGRLRKGQFMQQAYPGQHYKNEASARRQFNKVTSVRGGRGVESSGIRIEKRGRVPLPGGGQIGLWKIYVHCKHEEWNGEPAKLFPCKDHICIDDQHSFVRSFTATSMQYTRLEDKPYIEVILQPIIEAKIQEWLQHESWPPKYWDVAAVVTPAAMSTLTEANQLQLDSIQVE